jgi:lia operon protein LiaF
LIAFGVLQIFSYFLKVNFLAILFALGLIILGIILLLRPNIGLLGPGAKFRPICEINRNTEWIAQNEEIWTFIGDIHLDLSRADIPPGETTIRIFGFIGDIELLSAQDIGISFSSAGFLNQTSFLGQKREVFFTPVSYESDNFTEFERRIRIEIMGFVVESNLELVM